MFLRNETSISIAVESTKDNYGFVLRGVQMGSISLTHPRPDRVACVPKSQVPILRCSRKLAMNEALEFLLQPRGVPTH